MNRYENMDRIRAIWEFELTTVSIFNLVWKFFWEARTKNILLEDMAKIQFSRQFYVKPLFKMFLFES